MALYNNVITAVLTGPQASEIKANLSTRWGVKQKDWTPFDINIRFSIKPPLGAGVILSHEGQTIGEGYVMEKTGRTSAKVRY